MRVAQVIAQLETARCGLRGDGEKSLGPQHTGRGRKERPQIADIDEYVRRQQKIGAIRRFGLQKRRSAIRSPEEKRRGAAAMNASVISLRSLSPISSMYAFCLAATPMTGL